MRHAVQLGGRGPLAGWSQERPAELAQCRGLPGPPARHGQDPPETAHSLQRLQHARPCILCAVALTESLR